MSGKGMSTPTSLSTTQTDSSSSTTPPTADAASASSAPPGAADAGGSDVDESAALLESLLSDVDEGTDLDDVWNVSHDGESLLGRLYKSLKPLVMGASDVDEMTAVRIVVLLRLCLTWLRDCVDGAGTDYLQEVLLMFGDVNEAVPHFDKIKAHFKKGDKDWVNALKVGGKECLVSAAISFLPSDAELLHRLLRILPELQEYLWRTSGDAAVRGKWAKVSESVRKRLTKRQAEGMCACIADMLTYC